MSVAADQFRSVLGSWATGVTIVTSREGAHVHGMTVSAFASVSLEPPLVLICTSKASETSQLIERSGVFAVNVLEERQQELSALFANKAVEQARFDGLECDDGATGCPHIPGAIATLDCRVQSAVDAGDHFIYIGLVEAAETNETAPLLYYHGGYRKLADA
jgi:flavin reductase (DIM6/NTAB) family NADH-FMN oxidoreductase RutF